MKIRTRLAIAFVTITVVPIVLIFVAAFGLVNYQEHLFQKTYGLSEQIDLLSGNQTQVFNRLTQGIQEEIREAVGENTDLFEEPAYLSKVNEELRDKYSYLVIRKGKDITFCGSEDGREFCERLAPYGDQEVWQAVFTWMARNSIWSNRSISGFQMIHRAVCSS